MAIYNGQGDVTIRTAILAKDNYQNKTWRETTLEVISNFKFKLSIKELSKDNI